jgi:two-component system, chemotaxis family, sensor kinase CheA
VKEKGKFLLEVQSQLLNFKITLQDLNKKTNHKKSLEVMNEIMNQLSEIAGLYGLNTIFQYAAKIRQLLGVLVLSDEAINETVKNLLFDTEILLNSIVKDVMLEDKNLKSRYKESLDAIDEVLKKNAPDESTKMPMVRFQEVFIDEALDLINQLEEKMLQLESDPSDSTMIDQVFRIMHTLKGNSNMFGYKYLSEITHELESIYDDIRSKKTENSRHILENTLQCIDHFRNLISDPDLGNINVRNRHYAILGDIRGILSKETLPELSDAMLENSKNEKDRYTLYIFFMPGKDIFIDGTNPLYFIYDLHELGECYITPVIDEAGLRSGFDPQKCYTAWHIILVTSSTEEDIREHFLFLREDSQPLIRMLGSGNLLQNDKFRDYVKKNAEKSLKPIDINIRLFTDEEKNAYHSKPDIKDARDPIASVRVASQKLDQMMNLISELVTKQAELSMLVAGLDNQRLTEVAESIENISRDLRDNAFSISLIPLEKSVIRFQRLVRDVSNRFGKKINFIIEGKETELDKTLIEKIVDPIMHILRNSIDHGIEKPAERAKKGKPETGTIVLRAYPSGAHVVIEISDDGAGINLDKVKETAIKKGIISKNEQIGRDDLMQMIISPGFSTAENISEVSGRGVGMDVVSQKIAEIRGKLEIHTEKDRGTTMTIELPLTISIIDSLLILVGNEYYLVPLAVVERCAEVKAETIINAENKYIVLDGAFIPFIDLRGEFSIQNDRPQVQQVLLVRFREIMVGLIVDQVIGNYQAVLKALGEAYKKQENISGASILGSGEIALVLDTNRIIQEFAARNDLKVNAMA